MSRTTAVFSKAIFNWNPTIFAVVLIIRDLQRLHSDKLQSKSLRLRSCFFGISEEMTKNVKWRSSRRDSAVDGYEEIDDH